MVAFCVVGMIILGLILIYAFLMLPACRKIPRKYLRDYAHRGLHGSAEPERRESGGNAPESTSSAESCASGETGKNAPKSTSCAESPASGETGGDAPKSASCAESSASGETGGDAPKSTNCAESSASGETSRLIPENSLAAFRRAASRGFAVELDLQLSRDGEVYVFHDYDTERMTGHAGKLSDMTSDEIDALRLAGTDERIPRFSEVLKLINHAVPILVELKGESMDASLCPKADALLREYGEGYVIESFNPILLSWFRKNHPEVVRGLLYTNLMKSNRFKPLNVILWGMMLNFLARPAFIAYDKETSGSLPVRLACGLFGAERFVWTIRTPEEYEKNSDAHAIFEGFLPDGE